MSKKGHLKGFLGYLQRTDILLWLIVAAVSVYSLLLIKSISDAVDTNYFRVQIFAVALGVVGAVLVSLIDYVEISNFWYLLGGFSVFLMLYTAWFGESTTGSGGVDARAWINIAGRTFQSSELVKILFCITFAKHLDTVQKKGTINAPVQVVLLGLHALIPVLLCFLQGDAGAGVVFFAMFIFMSLSAGVQMRYFGILAVLLIGGMPLLWQYGMKEYQKNRFIAVFNLEDPSVQADLGYQQYQARTSIGSGGMTGQGLFQGDRVASKAVPFQQSDMIFSVAGEELGFWGCTLIIVLLFLLMVKVVHVAHSSRDDLGKYICFGFLGMLALQTVSNIGMALSLLPAMGVTLPFFSAGGSSAACLYWGIGLLQSVYMRRKESDGLRLKRKTPLRFTYQQMKEM